MTKKEQKKFVRIFRDYFKSIGAESLGERVGPTSQFALRTVAGSANAVIYDDWIHFRFADPKAALEVLREQGDPVSIGMLNKYSGKWNHAYYSYSAEQALEMFKASLTPLLPKPKKDYSELANKVRDLLDSGDDTGCNGVIVCGIEEFLALQKHFFQLTGEHCGTVVSDYDESEAKEPA